MNTNQSRLFSSVPNLSEPIHRGRTRVAGTARLLLAKSMLCLFCAQAVATPVDVNTADAEAIADALHGIGPKVASAIVEYRDSNGLFTAAEDLLKVKGVGPVLFEKNRSDIRLGTTGSTSESE